MSNQLALSTLLPALPVGDSRNQTFIGIDFGTSTTVASYSLIGDKDNPIKVDTLIVRQLLEDGRISENRLVPSAIAWINDRLLIGEGAWRLKHKLEHGRNLWHSFKMQLGADLGKEYRQTLLDSGHPIATIERSQDAAKVFFRFLKHGIDEYIAAHDLPRPVRYAVSIPASFESNQRRDLLGALDAAGIPVTDRALIDEPNAAFLSYLAEYSASNPSHYQIPDNGSLRIMVFDFGAGTCDISVLGVGRGGSAFQSRNLAISRFVPLGGNDIDRTIAREILLPQVLEANALDADDLRTPDRKRILNALLGSAEQLKIKLCKNVSAQMVRHRLPPLATAEARLKHRFDNPIRLPKRTLQIPELSISYQEFAKLMKPFLDPESCFDQYEEDSGGTVSVFTPIRSALDKAGVGWDELDMILMVGGSAQNPYVQNALAEAFPEIYLEIPRDMRSHVSLGAAIHAQLLHGFGVDLIKPITSEPILYLTRDNNTHTLVPAGTEIPYPPVTAADLRPARDAQEQIEIPIFVSSQDKLLHVIQITPEPGQVFSRASKVTLRAEITHDKLVEITAFVDGRLAHSHNLNPFANRPVSPKERTVYEAMREANDSAAANGGRPRLESLRSLARAYAETGNDLRCAEVLELLQQLEPHQRHETGICYHYSRAGKAKLSDDWAEIAYRQNPSAVNAYNLALRHESKDEAAYRRLMEAAITEDPEAAYAMLAYGQFLKREEESRRAEELIAKAFALFLEAFREGSLELHDYGRLITAAKLMGETQLAREVDEAYRTKIQEKERGFNPDYLLESGSLALRRESGVLTHR